MTTTSPTFKVTHFGVLSCVSAGKAHRDKSYVWQYDFLFSYLTDICLKLYRGVKQSNLLLRKRISRKKMRQTEVTEELKKHKINFIYNMVQQFIIKPYNLSHCHSHYSSSNVHLFACFYLCLFTSLGTSAFVQVCKII